jgi:hypothetical protein
MDAFVRISFRCEQVGLRATRSLEHAAIGDLNVEMGRILAFEE